MIRRDRMQSRREPASFVLMMILLLATQESALHAAGYSFVNIVDTTDGSPAGLFTDFGLAPAVSGSTVAFRGVYGTTEGIFTGNGLTTKLIASSVDSTALGPMGPLSEPVISGENVAFIALQHQVFRSNGTTLTTIATGDGPYPGYFDHFDKFSVAISGTTVAFTGGGTQNGVFTGNGESITRIAGEGDPSPAGQLNEFGRTDIDGEVVMVRASGKLLTHDGTSITVIAKQGDPAPQGTFDDFYEGGLSGSKVAFGASFDTFHRGIFVGDGGPLTTIAKSGDQTTIGEFLRFASPSISGDLVAFAATCWNEDGIFVGSEGAITNVIHGGSPLFGSVVSHVFFGRHGLDPTGTGNLCFRYSLNDGRHGIALAIPIPSSADFNRDGDVDGADFLTWQREFEVTKDGSDLELWKEQFGSVSPSGVSIPEPTANRLTIISLLLMALAARFGSSCPRNLIRKF